MREAAGLTQHQLAARTGIPRSRIAMWEMRGNIPKADDFEKIKEVLGAGFVESTPKIVNLNRGPFKNYEFKLLIRPLLLKQPIADLAKLTGFSKAYVSTIYNDKAEASQNFLRVLREELEGLNPTYKVDTPEQNELLQPVQSFNKISIRQPKIESAPFLVPFLPVKAQAGYVKAYDQAIYLDTLEKFSVPPGIDHRGAEWMYFEVEGDSMLDTFAPGDIIFCSMVPQVDWNEIRNFYVYVVITETEVMIKRLYRKDAENWVMISDNEDLYPQQILKVRDVKQLWVYRRTWHVQAKPPKVFKIKV